MGFGRAVLLCASFAVAACSYTSEDVGGTVRVSLEPAAPAAWFDEATAAIYLSPGDYAQFWEARQRGRHFQTHEAPAIFRDVATTSARRIVLPGRFIYEPVSVRAKPDEAVTVRVPVLLRTAHLTPANWRDERAKVLYIDIASVPDAFLVSWRKEGIKLSEQKVRRDLEALVPMLKEQHRVHGQHLDRADRLFDQAVVVAPEEATLDELLPLVKAIGEVQRKRHMPTGELFDVPAFQVRVAHPEALVFHRPEVAPSRASTYGGPDPDVAVRTPRWMNGTPQRVALDKAVPDIVDCYKHTLATHPKLQKTFDMALTVDADGKVPRAGVTREGDRDRLTYCTAQAFRKLRFEGVEHGHTFVVTVRLTVPEGLR